MGIMTAAPSEDEEDDEIDRRKASSSRFLFFLSIMAGETRGVVEASVATSVVFVLFQSLTV